jgi:hypothetical protein
MSHHTQPIVFLSGITVLSIMDDFLKFWFFFFGDTGA